MAILRLVGGFSLIVAFLLVLFGVVEAGPAQQFLFSAPEMVWEAAQPIYVLWKGFKSTAVICLDDRASAVEPSMATA